MHALLLEGTYRWALTCLTQDCRVENADVLHYHGDRMGIDDVRILIGEAYKTPLTREDRVFLLAYSAYTEDAQNALLKLFEEPPRTARFYLVTEQADVLLPTLRSRLISLGREDVFVKHDHQDFLRLTYGERLVMIAHHAKEKDDAERRRDPTFIRSLLELRPYFGTSGASKKMILEHIALLLPFHTSIQ
jgi:hypothetical protein